MSLRPGVLPFQWLSRAIADGWIASPAQAVEEPYDTVAILIKPTTPPAAEAPSSDPINIQLIFKAPVNGAFFIQVCSPDSKKLLISIPSGLTVNNG